MRYANLLLHPAGFDEMLYRSHHTHQRCIVAWIRPSRALDQEFVFGKRGNVGGAGGQAVDHTAMGPARVCFLL